jgi:DNA-binding SARP family transcriptional activator
MKQSRSSLRPLSRNAVQPPAHAGVRLQLLDTFQVVCDEQPVELPQAAQRLVAFVALQNRPVQREYAAGMFWLDVCDERAAGNLRSTLWRIQTRVRGLLDVDGRSVHLQPDVGVDLRDAEQLAHDELANHTNGAYDVRVFAGELLPGWYDDDWILLERERYRQLRLRALDALCERHLEAGRIGEALEAGLIALSVEPLRESAHRALIRIHLANGNAVEALRQYDLCCRLLHDQLGVGPTQQLEDAIGALAQVETKR